MKMSGTPPLEAKLVSEITTSTESSSISERGGQIQDSYKVLESSLGGSFKAGLD